MNDFRQACNLKHDFHTRTSKPKVSGITTMLRFLRGTYAAATPPPQWGCSPCTKSLKLRVRRAQILG